MGIFQSIANWIRRPTPKWLVGIIQQIQNIIVSIILQIGQTYLAELEAKIIETAGTNLTSEEKFKVVFSWARENIAFSKLKDSALNLLIEALVSRLKESNFVEIG